MRRQLSADSRPPAIQNKVGGGLVSNSSSSSSEGKLRGCMRARGAPCVGSMRRLLILLSAMGVAVLSSAILAFAV